MLSKIFAIALTTYRESVRSKILYSVFFFALILVAISALFGSVTIGDQVRVIKDFGLTAVSLFTVAYAVISGSSLLSKELLRKTIYNILAKPVARWEFILGKYLGMLATSLLMLCMMALSLTVFAGIFEARPDFLLFQAYLFNFFELVIICAAAIFFSSIVVTPLLSGLFTFGLFLAGRCSNYLLYYLEQGRTDQSAGIFLKGLYFVLPHLDQLNICNEVVYGKTVGLGYVLSSALYSFGYAGVLLVLAQFLFKNREFN